MRLEHLFLHLLDFAGKDNLSRCRRVNAGCLDGNEDVSAVLEEVVSVQGDDTSLIRLSDIGKADRETTGVSPRAHEKKASRGPSHDIDHRHEHPVLVRVTGILDNGCRK